MLTRIDRVQITAADAITLADRFVRLLDAEIAHADDVPALRARRTVLRLGDGEVEILEPTGPGQVADHLESGRGGPFAVGFATPSIHRLRRQLAERGIVPTNVGHERHFIDAGRLGIPGLNVVISPDEERPRVGLFTRFYEATHLTDNARASATRLAQTFALDAREFVPIESTQYGYRGFLTLFRGTELDRVETINPYDAAKTMGRFFGRFGPSLYMCYAETDRLSDLRARLKSLAPKDWTGSDNNDDGLFIHPKALGGLMVGVSRTTYAWTWSGHPERVRPR